MQAAELIFEDIKNHGRVISDEHLLKFLFCKIFMVTYNSLIVPVSVSYSKKTLEVHLNALKETVLSVANARPVDHFIVFAARFHIF